MEGGAAWARGTAARCDRGGGLVFQGTVDGQFLALDASTGKELWSYDNQAATLAGPISYEVDGEQYVAVLAGYGTSFFLINGFFAPREGAPVNGRVYVFKFGGAAPKPAIDFTRIPTPRPPVLRVTADAYQRGAQLYEDYCLVLPRHCRDHRRRASRPAEVGPAAGRRPVEASRRRRRPRRAGDAAVRAICDGRGSGTDPRLRRTAGGDVLRGGTGRRPQGVTRNQRAVLMSYTSSVS